MSGPSRISRIRGYMREHLDNGDATLDLLPSHTDLEWVHHPHGIRQEGIAVGKSAYSTVVAFLTGPGTADRMIRFATISHDASRRLRPLDELNIDNVRHCSLNSPFKYFNCSSPLEIQLFAFVVQWYYISSGRMRGEEIESCSLTFRTFCETLHWAAGAEDRAGQDAEYASTLGKGQSVLGHPSFAHDLSSITRQTRDTVKTGTVAPTLPINTRYLQDPTRAILPVVAQNMATAPRQPYQDICSQFTQGEGPHGLKRADIIRWIQGSTQVRGTQQPTPVTEKAATDVCPSPLLDVVDSIELPPKTRNGSSTLLLPPSHLVPGSDEYSDWAWDSLELLERLQWDWDGEQRPQPEHWRNREVGRWWYTSEAEYAKMSPKQQQIRDDIGRIMESDLGRRLEGYNACSHCHEGGYECWVYTPKILESSELAGCGSACVHCRAVSYPSPCDALQFKTSLQARINTENAAESQCLMGVGDTRLTSATGTHNSRGTKRKADDANGPDQDAQLESLARLMQEKYTKLDQIEEANERFSLFDAQQNAEGERMYEELDVEKERLWQEYAKKCNEAEARTEKKGKELRQHTDNEMKRLKLETRDLDHEIDVIKGKIKLVRYEILGWETSQG